MDIYNKRYNTSSTFVLQEGPSGAGSHQSQRAVVWGTDINIDEVIRDFNRFVDEFTDSESGHHKYRDMLDQVYIIIMIIFLSLFILMKIIIIIKKIIKREYSA